MEREELAELFQTYGTDVFRLAFSYLGSRPDAEDICQSVFLKLAEGRQGPRPGKEKSWLLACTANACKSHLRSFWYRSVGELDEAALFQDGEDRAVYAAVKGGEALARAGVLFLWAAGIVTVLLILADIPYMDFGRELPEWSTALFLTDVVERFCRSGEYLVFAALLPYVRSSNSADRKKLGAAGFCFAAAGAACSALFCVFFGAVLGEYYSMADYPIAAAGSLADVVLFKRLDGAACAVWSMASAFRMGVMLFAAWSVIGEVLKCSRGASQPAPGKESCA